MDPVPLAAGTLSSLGKDPIKKAVVLSLPTIESSFVAHHAKGMLGWDNPEYPALRLTAEVLNATESFLWVCSYSPNYHLSLIAMMVNSDTFVALAWHTAHQFPQTSSLDL